MKGQSSLEGRENLVSYIVRSSERNTGWMRCVQPAALLQEWRHFITHHHLRNIKSGGRSQY